MRFGGDQQVGTMGANEMVVIAEAVPNMESLKLPEAMESQSEPVYASDPASDRNRWTAWLNPGSQLACCHGCIFPRIGNQYAHEDYGPALGGSRQVKTSSYGDVDV